MDWSHAGAVYRWEEGGTAARTLGSLDVRGLGDDEKPANGAEEQPAEETKCRKGSRQEGVAGVAPAAGRGLPIGSGSMGVVEDLGLTQERDGKAWTQRAPAPYLEFGREAGLGLSGRVRSREGFLEDWYRVRALYF